MSGTLGHWESGSLGWLPSHHSFLAANFYAHALPHGLILLLILLRICFEPSEQWQPVLRRALARGFSRPTVALMHFYQYLTSCTHALGIVYLALSLHGGKPLALAAARAVLFPWATFVGMAWSVLSRWSPTRSLRPPWTMLPRDQFPKDDAIAAEIARKMIFRWRRELPPTPPSSLPPSLPSSLSGRRSAIHIYTGRHIHMCMYTCTHVHMYTCTHVHRPTLGWSLPVFMLLQLQHVAMPLLPWVEAALYSEMVSPPLLSLQSEVALLVACSAAWAGYSIGWCWHALDQAPWPVF